MAIPPFDASGRIPPGRHRCTLDEFEATFVLHTSFAQSATREEIFGEFLSALKFFQQYGAGFLECAWLGGGFASSKLNPSDIDATFIVDGAMHSQLSRRKREQLAKLARSGFPKLGLRVDAYVVARTRIAVPWQGAGITDEAKPYMSMRGVWDDWWSRERKHSTPTSPDVRDSDPVRGYLEVMMDG